MVSNQKYSYPVDWWALGILICEMLSGEPPFRVPSIGGTENWSLLFTRILNEPPDIPESIPDDARALIEKLLVKDPAQRLDFEGLVEDPWFSGLVWGVVAERGYEPGWRPVLDENGICQANFNPDALDEPRIDSPVEAAAAALRIENFSYVAPFSVDPDDTRSTIPDSFIIPDDG
jgi:serine/threonine protein kinase